MKNTLFFLATGLMAIIFLVYSFFGGIDDEIHVKTSSIDFTNTNTLYVAEKQAGEYVWKEVTKNDTIKSTISSDSDTKRYYYQKLSPIDGVYFRSDSRNPLTVKKDGNRMQITLTEGVFVFSLNDIFNTYDIHTDAVRIAPLGGGVFVFNNIPDVATASGAGRIFSLGALLDISLLFHGDVTGQFTLFPSSLFSFDPRFSEGLKNADMVRIATINSVRYVDMSGSHPFSAIFPSVGGSPKTRDIQNRLFFNLVREDMRQKSIEYTKKYHEFLDTKIETIRGSDIIAQYPYFFVNDSKKGIFYKGRIIDTLIGILKASETVDKASADTVKKSQGKPAPRKQNLPGLLLEMRDNAGLVTYGEALTIVRNCYYLWTFYNAVDPDEDIASRATDKKAFLDLIASVFPTESVKHDYFGTLTDIFTAYGANTIQKTDLDRILKDHLDTLIVNNELKRSDFLFFGYFLSQFVASSESVFSPDILTITLDLSTIIHSYYTYEAPTFSIEKRASTLSTILYLSAQIMNRLADNIVNIAFEKTKNNGQILLKSQYVTNGEANIPHDTITLLGKFMDSMSTNSGRTNRIEAEEKQLAAIDRVPGGNLAGNRKAFTDAYTKSHQLIHTLTNYATYTQTAQLNTGNRQISGLDISESESGSMTIAEVRTYFSQFDGVNMKKFHILNDPEKDGFFRIELPIDTNVFTLTFTPEGHTLSNISYVDTSGKREDKYRAFSVSLDERKRHLDAKAKSTNDPVRKRWYSFALYFQNTFIAVNGPPDDDTVIMSASGSDPAPSLKHGQMTPKLQLFVQRELIDKDFTVINALKNQRVAGASSVISLRNVFAKIENGAYTIFVDDVGIMLPGKQHTFTIRFSAKYDIATHEFYDIVPIVESNKLKIANVTVKIRPERLTVTDFPTKFAYLGYYLDELEGHITSNTKEATCLLDSSKVLVDGHMFPVTIVIKDTPTSQ